LENKTRKIFHFLSNDYRNKLTILLDYRNKLTILLDDITTKNANETVRCINMGLNHPKLMFRKEDDVTLRRFHNFMLQY